MDIDPSAPSDSYTAEIDWADGASTTVTANASPDGQIVPNGSGGFNVIANHSYATAGTYVISVTVSDADGNARHLEPAANVATITTISTPTQAAMRRPRSS